MKQVFCVVIFALFFSNQVFAGSGHSHGPGGSPAYHHKIRKKTAIKIAKKVIHDLVHKGKLDKSWNKSKFDAAVKKKFKKELEWVITFNKESAKDDKKKKLYVFLDLHGSYLGANFSGK